jgi:hypothetical protein
VVVSVVRDRISCGSAVSFCEFGTGFEALPIVVVTRGPFST